MRSVALLRGVNVGRAKRVAMADLRAVAEELGYCDVRTVLQSGNVIFTAARAPGAQAAARFSEALAERTGVSARVQLLSAAELRLVADQNTLVAGTADPSRLIVAFLARPEDRVLLEPLRAQDWGGEALALGERAAYLWCPHGTNDSPLNVAVSKLLGANVTSRNWKTVGRLLALCDQPGSAAAG